jgi:outer membrane protein assembly factor BamB
VDGENLICTPGALDAAVVALNKFTGVVVWQTKIDGIDRPGYSAIVAARIANVRQYVSALETGLFGIDANDGRTLWNHTLPSRYGASHAPIIFGEQILLAGGYRRARRVVSSASPMLSTDSSCSSVGSREVEAPELI